MLPNKLNLVVDMYGCPNRCKHCWLGHMPNIKMEDDLKIVEYFKNHFEKIAYYSWVREPDYCDDYKKRWVRDCEISIHTKPERFELASFYRIVRDEYYIPFLKSVNVKTIQLTIFGLEENTDFYVGRKGAFKEILEAARRLLKNDIAVRFQAFINEQNKYDLVKFVQYLKNSELKKCELFIHAGSCDGENQKLYSQRICEVPKELEMYCLNLNTWRTEKEWRKELQECQENVHLDFDDELTLNISNQLDIYFNFTHMSKEWKIGNIKKTDINELMKKIETRSIDVLKIADSTPISTLVELYGNKDSLRLFEKEDYLQYLINCHMKKERL